MLPLITTENTGPPTFRPLADFKDDPLLQRLMRADTSAHEACFSLRWCGLELPFNWMFVVDWLLGATQMIRLFLDPFLFANCWLFSDVTTHRRYHCLHAHAHVIMFHLQVRFLILLGRC